MADALWLLRIPGEALGMPQFKAPQTLTVTISPVGPDAAVDFVSSPSGTVTVTEGGELHLTDLTMKITNSGNWPGVFTATAAASGGLSGDWQATAVNGTALAAPTATPAALDLAPGASAEIAWSLSIADVKVPAGATPAADGTYTFAAVETTVDVAVALPPVG